MRSLFHLAILCLFATPPLLWAGPPTLDAQSKCLQTGPAPEEGYDSYQDALQRPDEVLIPDVPSYLWQLGCAPTAAGMVVGYWDGHGCPELIPGDASTQTEAVNQAIASDYYCPLCHFSDYSLPLDDPTTGLLPDRSEPPVGDEHPSDCLADFMKTSFSSELNYFGWTWFRDAAAGIAAYVEYVNDLNAWFLPKGYKAYVREIPTPALTWEDYVEEINAARPVIFLVDTAGDGVTDHFVTAIGWRDSKGYNEYACFDTWAPVDRIRWCRFRKLAPAAPWSVFGAIFCEISSSGSSGPGNKSLAEKNLAPNYPNPFNPSTKINFTIASPQNVRVAVYDVSGSLVKVLADRKFGAGEHAVDWLGTDAGGRAMPSGTYVVHLQSADGAESQKITLVR